MSTGTDWPRTLARGVARYRTAPFGVAVIEPQTGEIAAHNPAWDRVLGRDRAGDVIDLAASEAMDAGDGLVLEPATSAANGDAHRRGSLRVKQPHHAPVDVTVDVAQVGSPRHDGRAVIAVADDRSDPAKRAPVSEEPWEARIVYDADLFCVAAEPRLAEHTRGPNWWVGAHSALVGHPADVPRVLETARSVVNGDLTEASYTRRVIGAEWSWTTVMVELARLEGPEPLMLATLRSTDHGLETIEPGRLTRRELQVVRALFTGRRAAHIAEQQGVAVKTVRNQMQSAYKKLGVSGQSELVTRFAPPPVPATTESRRGRPPRAHGPSPSDDA